MQRSNAPLLSRSAAESLASVYRPYKCCCMYLRTMSRNLCWRVQRDGGDHVEAAACH
jgi:hypothetical protein